MAGNYASRRGITFIESLISVFLIGLTAAAYGVVLQMSSKNQALAGVYQQASGLAQHKVDQLRSVGFGRLNYTQLREAGIIDGSSTAQPFRFEQTDALAQIHPLATGTITVSDVSYNVREVTVRIAWTTGPTRRNDGDVTISALVTQG